MNKTGPLRPSRLGRALRDEIRHEIRDRFLTQAEVSAAIGVAQPTLNAWLNGRRNLSSEHLLLLLELLGYNVKLSAEAAAIRPRQSISGWSYEAGRIYLAMERLRDPLDGFAPATRNLSDSPAGDDYRRKPSR